MINIYWNVILVLLSTSDDIFVLMYVFVYYIYMLYIIFWLNEKYLFLMIIMRDENFKVISVVISVQYWGYF